MHLMYFTEQPMGAYDAQEGLTLRCDRTDVLEQAFRSGRRQPAV